MGQIYFFEWTINFLWDTTEIQLENTQNRSQDKAMKKLYKCVEWTTQFLGKCFSGCRQCKYIYVRLCVKDTVSCTICGPNSIDHFPGTHRIQTTSSKQAHCGPYIGKMQARLDAKTSPAEQ